MREVEKMQQAQVSKKEGQGKMELNRRAREERDDLEKKNDGRFEQLARQQKSHVKQPVQHHSLP